MAIYIFSHSYPLKLNGIDKETIKFEDVDGALKQTEHRGESYDRPLLCS